MHVKIMHKLKMAAIIFRYLTVLHPKMNILTIRGWGNVHLIMLIPIEYEFMLKKTNVQLICIIKMATSDFLCQPHFDYAAMDRKPSMRKFIYSGYSLSRNYTGSSIWSEV